MSSTSVNQSHSDAPAYLAENPHAGQGPVMLEIGVDTGALVLSAPVELIGREIEIHTLGSLITGRHAHEHDHEHGHEHGGDHGHDHGREGARGHAPHVAVIPRPLPSGRTATCAVFPDVEPGEYTLWLLPEGPAMPVHVLAGEVTAADWLPTSTS